MREGTDFIVLMASTIESRAAAIDVIMPSLETSSLRRVCRDASNCELVTTPSSDVGILWRFTAAKVGRNPFVRS